MLGKTTPPEIGNALTAGRDGARKLGLTRQRNRFSSILGQTAAAKGHSCKPSEAGNFVCLPQARGTRLFRRTPHDEQAVSVLLQARGIVHPHDSPEWAEPLVGLSVAGADRWPEALSDFVAGLQAASLDTSHAMTLRFHGERIEGVLCQLTMEQGRVHCRLKAESASLRQELGARQKQLRQALRRHGLVLAKMEVSA